MLLREGQAEAQAKGQGTTLRHGFDARSRGWLALCAVIALVLVIPGRAGGQTQSPAGTGRGQESGLPVSELQQFCTNNAAAAAAARLDRQTAKLVELEGQIGQRLQDLEAKRLEIAAWLRKREEAMQLATDGVVAIYARMRAEAAAQQLAAMDDAIAAAILVKLPARSAGVILNEMEAGRAARLTRIMLPPTTATSAKKS
jgi:flagellar motility protein MotE (MotC chaperone)